MNWSKSKYNDKNLVDYCSSCMDSYGSKPKEGVLGDRTGKYCKLGCGKYTRSFGAKNSPSFYNWSCCGGECDKT